MEKLEKQIVDYIYSTQYEDLSKEVIDSVQDRILDSIGVAMAAFNDDAPKAVRKYALNRKNNNGSFIWGTDLKVDSETAAFSNGTSVRYLDYNDTYLSLEPLHPSDMIPGLISLSEENNKTGKDLILAIATGYELAVNLCDVASLRKFGWDHVSFTGLGAAAGASKLLGFSKEQIRSALAIYSVPHASMRQTRVGELSMWKGAAAANAVRNAIFAANVVSSGFTGPFDFFEGEMGYVNQLLGGKLINPEIISNMSSKNTSRILDTYIKKWPVEYHAQSAIDACLELREEVDDTKSINKIEIETFDAAYEIIAKDPEKWDPKTRETADHSLPYTVSAALVDNIITQNSFSQDKINNKEIRRLLKSTTLNENAELSEGYPDGIPNRIIIHTNSGIFKSEVKYPRGHANNKMNRSEILSKFSKNTQNCYSANKINDIADKIFDIDTCKTISNIFEELKI
ncbi:MAG: MmgE/PrpD family protein [Dehalococcoidia bacterium]